MQILEKVKEFNKQKKPGLSMEIARCYANLIQMDHDSEEYDDELKRLERLMKMKCELRGDKKAIDVNTILLVIANLAEIGLIMNYEKVAAITTKAWGNIRKLNK